jgi:hypothetical protein
MSTSYRRATKEVAERAAPIIEAHHSDVLNAGVTIDWLYAKNPKGPALKHHGVPAFAICRIVNVKDRVKGNADVEICIDEGKYVDMPDAQKNALLDHELQHIMVVRDKEGMFKQDVVKRPKLELRMHDYDLGWFTVIAERHGPSSIEVYQARMIWQENGQAYFPMLNESAEPSKAKKKK